MSTMVACRLRFLRPRAACRRRTGVAGQVAGDYGRLFVVPNYQPPEASGWERPLRTSEYLLIDEYLTGRDPNRPAPRALCPGTGPPDGGARPGHRLRRLRRRRTHHGRKRLVPPEGLCDHARTQPGGAILLTLLWQSLRPVDYNYQVFVHLLDERGDVAQKDGQPVQWMRPTNSWQRRASKLRTTIASSSQRPSPPDAIQIAVGLYDPVTGQRLPVSAGPSSYAIELGARRGSLGGSPWQRR